MANNPVLTSNGCGVFLLSEQPSLDWATYGDEFVDRLGQHLADIMGGALAEQHMSTVPFQRAGRDHFYRRYTFSGLGLDTALAGIPLKDGNWQLGVEASDAKHAEAEADVWAAAIRNAQADIGQTSDHPWWAVLVPTSVFGSVVLDGSVTIAEITLIRPMVPYARFARESGMRRLGGGGEVEVVYPVVVSGTATGYQPRAAMNRANDQLLSLCASLTLDTDAYWEVAEAPLPHERDPASLPATEDPSLTGLAEGMQPPSNLVPSSFVAETVEKMKADSDVGELMAAYYHARSIEDISPSLAALIYVSTVEAIGSRFVPLSKCECCDACDKAVGYGRRFRNALKLVLPSKDAKRLSQLYDKRSKTAHQGALHSTEFRLWGPPNSFKHDPADYFLYQEVWHVRAAAGALLRLLVEDQLPTQDETEHNASPRA
ncbi:hypothetical protein [Arthrobacter pigmenti]